MPLINTAVPNLIQGVSQQPDSTRFDGQCEAQENALSSVADGLRKRPHTQHIAKLLNTAIAEDSFVHFINRDENEKYVVIHSGAGIEAWNIISGIKCLINGSATPLTPPSYLTTATPKESLKALTVADSTFIVNKDIGVGLSQTKTASLAKKGFVYIAQGDYQKKYELTVGGNLTGTVPSDQATFSVVVEDYYYRKGWERFRVADVNVTNAGSGYPASTSTTLDLTFIWGTLGNTLGRSRSYASINVMPEISVTFNASGGVASATVVNAGAFGQHNTEVSGGSFYGNYNAEILAAVQGDTITGTASSFETKSLLSTDASQADTSNIASSLFDDSLTSSFASVPLKVAAGGVGNIFTAGTTFTSPPLSATREGNSIIIERASGTGDFTLETSDGLGGAGIKAVYKRMDAVSDLPIKAPNNFVVEIVGDEDLDQDNYWVKFTTNSGADFGEGAWEETVAPDTSVGFDVNTMPMTIRSRNINILEIDTLSFDERVAGDEETNPNPSFVGQGINDIVFFKNRLGFITDDSVVFSEAGHFFNFFRTTVSTLLDSAPIDITVSSTKVTKLESATIFQENLMLFADNVQFVLKGGDLFTPKTVSVSPATNFSLEGSVSPLPLGSYIYFPFTRGSFTGLRELSLSANTETYDAVEVTEHVPAYIPSNIIEMAGTTAEDIIALLSGNEKECLYIYNYFWNNNQKVLSAWSKFSFTGEIRAMEFIDSALYLIITHHGQTQLVAMPIESNSGTLGTTRYGSEPVITTPYTPNNPTILVDDDGGGDGNGDTVIDLGGFTVVLYTDEFYTLYWNPTTGATIALDAEGNEVSVGNIYTVSSYYTPVYGEPSQPAFDPFTVATGDSGFTAEYNSLKTHHSSSTTSGQLDAPYVIRGIGGNVTTEDKCRLEFKVEEMTGEWEVFLQGNSPSVADSEIIPVATQIGNAGNYPSTGNNYVYGDDDVIVIFTPPNVDCDRMIFRLKEGYTGSLTISNLSVRVIPPVVVVPFQPIDKTVFTYPLFEGLPLSFYFDPIGLRTISADPDGMGPDATVFALTGGHRFINTQGSSYSPVQGQAWRPRWDSLTIDEGSTGFEASYDTIKTHYLSTSNYSVYDHPTIIRYLGGQPIAGSVVDVEFEVEEMTGPFTVQLTKTPQNAAEAQLQPSEIYTIDPSSVGTTQTLTFNVARQVEKMEFVLDQGTRTSGGGGGGGGGGGLSAETTGSISVNNIKVFASHYSDSARYPNNHLGV